MKSLCNFINEQKSIKYINEYLVGKISHFNANDYKKDKIKVHNREELENICLERLTKSTYLDLTDLDISEMKPESLSYTLFHNVEYRAYSLNTHNIIEITEINVSGWDISKIESLDSMFQSCKKLKAIYGLETWNTSNVTNMARMFKDCRKLKELDISNWDISNVKSMYSMFRNCIFLKKLNISTWDVRHVKNLMEMFYSCKRLVGDFSFLKIIAKTTYYSNMTYNTSDKLIQPTIII